jgi:8-oxo-dGTP pyrophosphatase MutT (NUDIX family)
MTRYDPEHIVSCVVAVRKGNRVLLLKRGPTDPWMPGKWCLPGGAVDPGEGPFQGALRELHEEAGISLSDHDILPVDVIELDTTTVYVFTAKAPRQRVQLLDGEHSDFRWVRLDEIHSFGTIPLVKPILRRMNNVRPRSSPKTRAFRT